MTASQMLLSTRLLCAGLVSFLIFSLLLVFGGEVDEARLLTQVTFFIGLIPPPVCFSAGLGLALAREVRSNRFGAWANGVALLVHSGAMIAILQAVLAG